MKRIFLFIGLLLSFSTLIAQKKVTKTVKTTGVNNVFIHLKFAQNIEVKNWNKNTISVEATVNINDNKENDVFSLTSDKNGKSLTIKSDYGNFFKKHKKNNITITNNNCTSYNYCTCSNKIIINYTIYVPNNIALKIKSISGSVSAESIKNNLTLDLISGNIIIKKHSNKMVLKTISGDIDVYVADATFRAKTLSGSVYSNLDIDFNNNSKAFGRKVTGTVKNGTASLKLNTISGNIYLRKI